jgi:hypothetical protein
LWVTDIAYTDLVWVTRCASISSSTRKFVAIYALAAPGDAMLTTNTMLENSGHAVCALNALAATLFGIVAGAS